MKKQKVNLKKLSLSKHKISTLNGNQLLGGAPGSLHCGPTSQLLNCATATSPPAPLISIDIRQDICEAIKYSKESLCPPCMFDF
ncbi:hypothetical protein [uncultured Kordia sp.]|uniref:hypothetical protein n=1 Tax=uncultured Kordia sp. TaxID=507699 RepID=UPI0026092605|nr:hypothetical protein [uncultured Kordia sp.]